MSKAEQWLLFNKKIASQYSKQLLAGQPNSEIPDELIDMHIFTKAGVVILDSNDQDRFFVLAYSPNGIPEPLQLSEQTVKWKKLNDHWYEYSCK